MLRFLSFALTLVTLLFLGNNAMAQDANIQWKDLSAGERQNILNTWRALPQDDKKPFMVYREEAIKSLSDEKKALYVDKAQERAAREKELEEAYQKRVAEEEKRLQTESKAKIEAAAAEEQVLQEEDDVAKPSKTPSANPDVQPKGEEKSDILPTIPAEDAPVSNSEPAISGEGVIPEKPVPAAEKAKKLFNKIF